MLCIGELLRMVKTYLGTEDKVKNSQLYLRGGHPFPSPNYLSAGFARRFLFPFSLSAWCQASFGAEWRLMTSAYFAIKL